MNDDPERKPTEPPIVVFGLDKDRKPRAGTFPAELAAVAAERGKSLNLVVSPIEGPTITALAKELKAGDLGKEGYEFIPTVIRAAYERLLVATGVVGSKAPTQDRKAKGSPSTTKDSVSSPPKLPASWPEIDVGFMVLCEDPTPGDGWFEAHVVEKVGPDLFRLTYRDYPGEGVQTRQRNQLALLPPVSD